MCDLIMKIDHMMGTAMQKITKHHLNSGNRSLQCPRIAEGFRSVNYDDLSRSIIEGFTRNKYGIYGNVMEYNG